MKTLKEHINSVLITESKQHPFFNKRIDTKSNEFDVGDVVLFKELLEPGDENAIMVVTENRGDRCQVAIVSSPLSRILGLSNQVYLCKELFKIGEIKFGGTAKRYQFNIQSVLSVCEQIGMDITETQLKLKNLGYI